MKSKSFNLKKWAKSRAGQQVFICIGFMIIPLLLLFLFTYFPFAEMIKFSFYKMKYTTPIDRREFVGWDNYLDVFRRNDCFGALKLSLFYMVGALIQLVLALYLATILSFKVKGGNLFKGLMFFPYLISGIAIGFIFKFFFTRGFVFDTILQWCGFQLENLPYWLKDQSVNNWSLTATSVWRYTGQNMVLFIGAMMSVDSELYEAASLDGANKWEQFKHIILPSIKTIITLNVILSITGSLSAFEAPFVITTGANGTGTYFVIMNKIAHTSQKVGLASAMSVVLLMIIFICTILQNVFFKYVFRDAASEDESYKAKKARLKAEKQVIKQIKKTGENEERSGEIMSSTAAAVKRKNMKHYSVGSIIWIIVEYASLIFFGFCAIIPIVSCITTAFKTDAEYQNTNVMAFPGSWLNFDNFVNAFKTANMGRAFLNSVIVMVVVLTVSVIVGSQLAYVLNRFKFPGNGFIRNLYTIAALLPAVAMQVTVYQIMSDLHLVNSLGGYIIMSCGTDVISMYIFIQFMENIPLSLDESAIIDGANYWQIYWKIMLPLLKPAIVTSCILKGVGVYNEYYAANLYLMRKEIRTMALSLYTFVGPMGSKYNLICAGVIISLLPALIVFVCCQKQIYSGITAGAVKG